MSTHSSDLLWESHSSEEHTLWVGCLKAIAPPAPQRDALIMLIPTDLVNRGAEALVQKVMDLASGQSALPPQAECDREIMANRLIPILSQESKVDFCRLCLHPTGMCVCQRAMAYPATGQWSFTSGTTTAQTSMASMGPLTTLSTSSTNMGGRYSTLSMPSTGAGVAAFPELPPPLATSRRPTPPPSYAVATSEVPPRTQPGTRTPGA